MFTFQKIMARTISQKLRFKPRPKPFLNGPRAKELKDTASCVLLTLVVSSKSMTHSWILPTLTKERALRIWWPISLQQEHSSEMKLMVVASLLEDWETLMSLEPTLCGIIVLIYTSEEVTKLYTFLLCWLHTMEKLLEIKLFLEWAKELLLSLPVPFSISLEFSIRLVKCFWDWNKSSLLFLRKHLTKEKIWDGPIELLLALYHQEISN